MITFNHMSSFNIKTNQNNLKINYYMNFIGKQEISIKKQLFNEMCKKGCVNYNKKYSCPLFTPRFEILTKDCQGLLIILFQCPLEQIDSTEYNKVRIANVVMKSRIDKLMRILENKFKTTFLSTGSCRLCKPCKLKLNQPCAHPDKKRYSLESIGVDCDILSKHLFNIPMLWYKEKKAPEYSCVVCGLLCNSEDVNKIKKSAEDLIKEIQ